jgi:septum formation protein
LRLILASASPSRARLLANAGLDFEVLTRPVDEESIRDSMAAAAVTAEDAAVTLAEIKAGRVAAQLQGDDTIVLGFDQILDLDGAWLGKPGSTAEAAAHLRRLQGRMHRLATAAVAFRGGSRIWHHVSAPRLWLRPLDAAAIQRYLDAAGPAILQTVGAYEYEGLGARLMARVEGDCFAIQGLPLLPVLQLLRDQQLLDE